MAHSCAGGRISLERRRGAASRRGVEVLGLVTTMPLTLLTLASLGLAWATPEVVRYWWLGAAAAALLERAMTFTYFIPTIIRLMRGDLGEAQAAAKARQWVRLGYIRHAATLAAWLAGL